MKTYTQCQLRKKNVIQVAWIPSEYASRYKVIKVLDDGQWDDGWIVDQTYSISNKEDVEAHERLYTRMSTYGN